MNIGQVTTNVDLASDQRWLGSTHGQDIAEGIALDTAAWVGNAAVIEDDGSRPGTNGTVPSGTAIAKTAAGLGVPVGTAGATNEGYLLEDVSLPLDTTEAANGALFWHGRVVTRFLPAGSGSDAAFQASVPLIRHV